ncbi:hypothetical protein [Alkalihalobacterium chitinilyticum]|nr:hypothetical protein [Alkalihalobacterium chitinilyticum]
MPAHHRQALEDPAKCPCYKTRLMDRSDLEPMAPGARHGKAQASN